MFEKTENKRKRGRGWPIFLAAALGSDLNDSEVELPEEHGEAGGQGGKDSVELEQVGVENHEEKLKFLNMARTKIRQNLRDGLIFY